MLQQERNNLAELLAREAPPQGAICRCIPAPHQSGCLERFPKAHRGEPVERFAIVRISWKAQLRGNTAGRQGVLEKTSIMSLHIPQMS